MHVVEYNRDSVSGDGGVEGKGFGAVIQHDTPFVGVGFWDNEKRHAEHAREKFRAKVQGVAVGG